MTGVTIFGQSLSFLLVLIGVGLCIFEAFAPGAHFIVIGVAVLAAGLLGLFVPAVATPFVPAFVVLGVGLGRCTSTATTNCTRGPGADRPRTPVTSAGSGVRRGGGDAAVRPRETRVRRLRLLVRRSLHLGTIPEGKDVVVVDPGGGNIVTVEVVDGDDKIDRELDREREGSDTA